MVEIVTFDLATRLVLVGALLVVLLIVVYANGGFDE
jgi:hypothetical protein